MSKVLNYNKFFENFSSKKITESNEESVQTANAQAQKTDPKNKQTTPTKADGSQNKKSNFDKSLGDSLNRARVDAAKITQAQPANAGEKKPAAEKIQGKKQPAPSVKPSAQTQKDNDKVETNQKQDTSTSQKSEDSTKDKKESEQKKSTPEVEKKIEEIKAKFNAELNKAQAEKKSKLAEVDNMHKKWLSDENTKDKADFLKAWKLGQIETEFSQKWGKVKKQIDEKIKKMKETGKVII